MKLTKLVAVLILLGLAQSAFARPVHPEAQFTADQQEKMFSFFMRKYNKNYASPQEFETRFQNFKNSLARAQLRNNQVGALNYGITKFSDMTPEEFRTQFLLTSPIPFVAEDAKDVNFPANVDLPNVWDWRQQSPFPVTPVKNQKQCGSCWAFSTAEAIESAWIMGGKATNSTVDLAPQQIVDCDTSDDGCNGGDPPTAYEYVIKAGGLESEQDYPYTAKDGKCTFDKSKVVATISSWKYGTTKGDENTMQQNLYSVGPLSICVDASSWQDYTSGVIKSGCGQTLDHCVELVGYDASSSKEPYWIVRNSWGADWGEQGYVWVEMGKNLCGITNECTYPIV